MSSTTSTLGGAEESHHGSGSNYLNATKGIASWLFTIDHKRIGLMYLVVILGFFLAGGLLAMAVRYELLDPQPTFAAATYNKIFTLHGAIMVFLVLVPAIPASLGNFLLPLQLGAKDVAFPKLNLLSFWVYLFGRVGSFYYFHCLAFSHIVF